MDENSLFTPFDEITQTRELQMLKTIIPYMPHDFTKADDSYGSLHITYEFNENDRLCTGTSVCREQKDMADRRLSMLNALKKYCSKSEQDTIDNLLNIFSDTGD